MATGSGTAARWWGGTPAAGRALLLYDDGEDEWVALEREEVVWHCQLAGPSGCLSRPAAW